MVDAIGELISPLKMNGRYDKEYDAIYPKIGDYSMFNGGWCVKIREIGLRVLEGESNGFMMRSKSTKSLLPKLLKL